ncbi:MAG: TA system VapC family ribonuclease toxin [Acidimicrobiales bacterium]
MLIDTNILIYAVDETFTEHDRVRTWLETVLNGSTRVGMPWESLAGFVRIVTNPRAMRYPLSPINAWNYVHAWATADLVWHPAPTDHHMEVLGSLVTSLELTGNLIPDAHLAAIAIEYGIAVVSADSDFALFASWVPWINPLCL